MKTLLLTVIFSAIAFAQEHGGEAAAHPEPDMTLWKVANFVLLAGVLGWLIGKHAGPFFKARTEEIRKGIDEAQKMKADAEARAAAMEQRLARIGEEIEALRAEGAAEERAEAKRLRNETAREIARIGAQAEHEVASVVKGAKAELRRHAADLAVDLARKKAADRISATDQDHLIESFAKNLKSSQ